MSHEACPPLGAPDAGRLTTVVRVPAALPRPVLVAAAALLTLLAGCSSVADDARTAPRQYLAIGDSYTAGYRPAVDGEEETNTEDGFAWTVAEETGLSLVGASCSGITAVDFVGGEPCEDDMRGPGALAPTEGPEMHAVLDHLDRHGDDVELVTVALGVNDLDPCELDAQWKRCVTTAVARATRSLDTLLGELRSRLGPDVPILGLTYPDVWLGAPVAEPDSVEAPDVAERSVAVFRDVVNPALRRTYAAHGARFVDVTREFGAYVPSARTERTAEHGRLPVRVARICDLTYYCALGDVHPTREGHRAIARLVLESVEPRSAG